MTTAENRIRTNGKSILKRVKRYWILYLFLFPAALYVFLFSYLPMPGIQIAFKNYSISKGIAESPWAGMKWFRYFFNSKQFGTILSNTLTISIYSMVGNFILPVILALSLNYVSNKTFKKTMQTVTYLPHFISTVVMVGMLSAFMSPRTGFINTVIKAITGDTVYFFGKPEYFSHLYAWSGFWQGTGWNSIIYMAALTSISPELHESAVIDGASLLQRVWHIDIPGIMPTMIIMLILAAGGIMSVGFEKAFLMQNTLNLASSEIISTYTYKMGLIDQKFSYSTAIGLFNNVINFTLLSVVNFFAGRLSGSSLW